MSDIDAELYAALDAYLKYGEDTFNPLIAEGEPNQPGHGGDYSGPGWAARALRALRAALPKLRQDAQQARDIAALASQHGWNGVENSKVLATFLADRLEQAKADRAALQQVMQVLGPQVPSVDYTNPGNLAGLTYEADEALRIVKARGISYQGGAQYRSTRRPVH